MPWGPLDVKETLRCAEVPGVSWTPSFQGHLMSSAGAGQETNDKTTE